MSLFGMLTGTISSGVLLLREIDPEYKTPAANNLVLGSSFGIAFGFPVLILVGMAPKGDTMLFLVIGICVVYLALLLTFLLKFKGRKEIVLADPAELNHYLSSGTIKGIVTFTLAIRILKSGGYLVIDELENHFNKEIVATLIRFFMDAGLNHMGGTLIFSTHYPELLDEFERNDCIYIIRNRNGITVSNLSDILKRNDLKKSDAYQSGFLEGTVPTYEAYMSLKKSIRRALEKED